ncbi:hypothetical protein QQG55_32970 [Brugia pahangi]
MKCRRWTTKPFKLPTMADLPASRTTRSRPFARVGLDYLGPVNIRSDNGLTKRWVALFTCFTTRAVHLEVVKLFQPKAFTCFQKIYSKTRLSRINLKRQRWSIPVNF